MTLPETIFQIVDPEASLVCEECSQYGQKMMLLGSGRFLRACKKISDLYNYGREFEAKIIRQKTDETVKARRFFITGMDVSFETQAEFAVDSTFKIDLFMLPEGSQGSA